MMTTQGEWDAAPEHIQAELRLEARAVVVAFLEAADARTEFLTPGEACRNPYCLPDKTHTRIVTAWWVWA